jgi:DNA-directed RNA polymerase specialized sigma24 family protein
MSSLHRQSESDVSRAAGAAGGGAQAELAALTSRLMAGDQSAFARLHDMLAPGLTRHFARKLAGIGVDDGRGGGGGSGGLAEELAQRTWITFWRALAAGAYDPARARPSTFLYAVAANIWLRHLRERSRRGPVALAEGADWPLSSAADDPAAALECAAAVELVGRVVGGAESEATEADEAAFTEADRQLLRAIADGRTDRELAAELGISPSTAHARKKGVLGRLAGFLAGRGIGPSAVGAGSEQRRGTT